jgi:hypothetical protein
VSLARAKSEALAVARRHFPTADEIRLCLAHGELLAEVWVKGSCEIVHTEVFV